jgi:hypothetical protein
MTFSRDAVMSIQMRMPDTRQRSKRKTAHILHSRREFLIPKESKAERSRIVTQTREKENNKRKQSQLAKFSSLHILTQGAEYNRVRSIRHKIL